MQKFYSRAVSVLLAVVMVCSLFTVLPITASAAETVLSGKVNDDISWTFDSEGTLTLTGSGEMPDYSYTGTNLAPWESFKNEIKKAVIGNGITKLGAYNFYYCRNLTSVKVPDSLTALGDNAINNCSALKNFEVPSTITKMGAFSNKKLYFSGDNYNITFTDNFYRYSSSTSCYCDPDSSVYQTLNDRKSTTYPSNVRFKGTLIAVNDDPVTITYYHTDDRVTDGPTEGTQTGYYTIPTEEPTLTGAEFLGWTTNWGFTSMPTVYKPGEKVYFSDDMTLYSVWKRRVEFYSGNTFVASKDVVFDEYISDSDLAEKPNDSLYPEGKDFVGYYSDDNITSYFTYSDGSFRASNGIYWYCFTDGVFKLYAKYLEAPEFLGTTASLDGVIRLNFYIDTNGHSVSVTYRDLDIDTAHDNTDTGESTLYHPTVISGETRMYSIYVNAKAIADEFLITLNYNGKQKTMTTSVKKYLETLAADPEQYAPENSEGLLNLCYATLNYGAAAQKQFNHYGTIESTGRTIPMANENVPPSYIATEVPDNIQPDTGSQADFSDLGLEYYASSLGLFFDTNYAICFEKIEDKNLSFHYIYNNQYNRIDSQNVGYVDYEVWKDFELIDSGTHELVAYSIDHIAAKDILTDIPVVVFYNNRAYNYTFSPRTYIAKVLSDTGVNPTYEENEKTGNEAQFQSKANLENTVKAIYDYSTRAAEYWA